MITHTTKMTMLNSLMLEHTVSLASVQRYKSEHYNEIQSMDTLFRFKTDEDVRRYLILLSWLIKRSDATLLTPLFQRYEASSITEDEIERYKLPLITALVYNPRFFSEVWNSCGAIQEELSAEYNRLGICSAPGIERRRIIIPIHHEIGIKRATSNKKVRSPLGHLIKLKDDHDADVGDCQLWIRLNSISFRVERTGNYTPIAVEFSAPHWDKPKLVMLERKEYLGENIYASKDILFNDERIITISIFCEKDKED